MNGLPKFDAIHKYVSEVRAFLLASKPSDFRAGTSLSVSKFPSGCCDDASTLLSLYLQDQGINVFENIYGETLSGKSHVWLQFEDLIIDITRDQFSESDHKVDLLIMEKADDWHLKFVNIVNRGVANHNQLSLLGAQFYFAMLDALNKLNAYLNDKST
tara:strand:+ start:1074 stop:1547 length:474 start_codon:yes stop_codon:yes gene_type:complete